MALLCAGFVLWLASAWWVAHELTRRARPMCPELPADLAGKPWENLRLNSSDGEVCGAWYRSGNAEQPTVILLHGNGGTRRSMLPMAEWLESRGCGVLLVTLRAHGDSTGDYNDLGYGARHDVIAAVNWLKQRETTGRIVIWGESLGGAAATFAAKDVGERVDGFVLDGVYQDLCTAVWNRLDSVLPNGLDLLAYVGLRIMSPMVIPHLQQIAPREAIRAIPAKIPVVLLTGAADRRCRPEEAAALAKGAGSQAEVIVIPGADHSQTWSTDALAVQAAVSRLLARVRD